MIRTREIKCFVSRGYNDLIMRYNDNAKASPSTQCSIHFFICEQKWNKLN